MEGGFLFVPNPSDWKKMGCDLSPELGESQVLHDPCVLQKGGWHHTRLGPGIKYYEILEAGGTWIPSFSLTRTALMHVKIGCFAG